MFIFFLCTPVLVNLSMGILWGLSLSWVTPGSIFPFVSPKYLGSNYLLSLNSPVVLKFRVDVPFSLTQSQGWAERILYQLPFKVFLSRVIHCGCCSLLCFEWEVPDSVVLFAQALGFVPSNWSSCNLSFCFQRPLWICAFCHFWTPTINLNFVPPLLDFSKDA